MSIELVYLRLRHCPLAVALSQSLHVLLIQVLGILGLLHLHHALLLIIRHYDLLSVVTDLSLLLVGEVLVELSPLTLFFIPLAVGIINLSVKLHLVLHGSLPLQVFLKLLVSHVVPHFLRLSSFLLQVLDLSHLLTHVVLVDLLLHVMLFLVP